MNKPTNATNATLELDCPWCAETLRASLDEFVDGLACPACRVEVILADDAARLDDRSDRRVARPLAA